MSKKILIAAFAVTIVCAANMASAQKAADKEVGALTTAELYSETNRLCVADPKGKRLWAVCMLASRFEGMDEAQSKTFCIRSNGGCIVWGRPRTPPQ